MNHAETRRFQKIIRLLHAYSLLRECVLPSRCLETALVYVIIWRLLHSNGSTRDNTFEIREECMRVFL
jgi:hypothetical protein